MNVLIQKLGGRKLLLSLLLVALGTFLHAQVGLNEHLTTLFLGVLGFFVAGNSASYIGHGMVEKAKVQADAAAQAAATVPVTPSPAVDVEMLTQKLGEMVSADLKIIAEALQKNEAVRVEMMKATENAQKLGSMLVEIIKENK